MVPVRRLCLLMVCLVQASAQLLCPTFTIADLGSTTMLSTEGLLVGSLVPVGETSSDIPVRIINYKILCDASGLRRNTSSSISVLVEFQCDFTGGSGNLANCDGVTNITRQYQYVCSSSNEWQNAGAVQTLNPSATFQTEPTNQCSLCSDTRTAEADTHCLSCTGCNQGQRRCYVDTSFEEQCCNFYLENVCVAECPTSLVANSTTFDCECPSLTLGNGSVSLTRGNAIGSVATHTCITGYDRVGVVERTCTTGGWNGSAPICNLTKCANLNPIKDGGVMVRPDNRTLNALATYSCNTDYSLRGGDRVRICQAGGVWNGSEPKCVLDEKDCGECGPGTCNKTTGKCACPSNSHGEHCSKLCKATDIDPDCTECGFDASGNPICLRCKGDREPEQDGKCPREGTTDERSSSCDTGCIVGIVLAILGAVIMAVVVALVVYAVYSYLTNPATKLAKAGTEGLNGVARDNPLYLPPDEIVGDVETA